MKKSLIALAVFGTFATTASAQVTLYGALDASYGTFETETTDATGTTTDEVTGLFDGDAFTSPSRWGIKASTDLGNGLKGVAHLESAVDITTGNAGNPATIELPGVGDVDANNNLFHRKAVVGLAGGFGTVLLGRFDTPIHGVLDDTGAFGTAGLDTARDSFVVPGTDVEVGYGAAAGGSRRSNSINYISPEFGGFSAKLQFVNQETEEGGATAETTGFGVAAAYENGPFLIAAGYDSNELEGDEVGPEQTSWLVGGTYDFNVAKAFVQYGNFENDTAGATTEAQQLNIGTKVPMGAFTFLASVGRTEAETAAGADFEGTNYVLGVNYNLAKTTYLYARAGRVGHLEADVGGFETETTAYGVGLRHAF